MTPLIVYTAICGAFPDTLRPVIAPPDPDGRPILYLAYGCGRQPAAGWTKMEPHWTHPDPRRTARRVKILGPAVAQENQIILWHDGSHQLLVNPWLLADHYLAGADLASFRHPDRDCVYQELAACLKLKKDDPALMQRQVDFYRRDGYPEHAGLFETACVLRRLTPAVQQFNQRWWHELVRGSRRDQLSLNYCLWAAARDGQTVSIAEIPGRRDKSEFFRFYPHR